MSRTIAAASNPGPKRCMPPGRTVVAKNVARFRLSTGQWEALPPLLPASPPDHARDPGAGGGRECGVDPPGRENEWFEVPGVAMAFPDRHVGIGVDIEVGEHPAGAEHESARGLLEFGEAEEAGLDLTKQAGVMMVAAPRIGPAEGEVTGEGRGLADGGDGVWVERQAVEGTGVPVRMAGGVGGRQHGVQAVVEHPGIETGAGRILDRQASDGIDGSVCGDHGGSEDGRRGTSPDQDDSAYPSRMADAEGMGVNVGRRRSRLPRGSVVRYGSHLHGPTRESETTDPEIGQA